jgi:hypothetical protein
MKPVSLLGLVVAGVVGLQGSIAQADRDTAPGVRPVPNAPLSCDCIKQLPLFSGAVHVRPVAPADKASPVTIGPADAGRERG